MSTFKPNSWSDFLWGAGSIVGLVALRKIIALFQYPALSGVNKIAFKPIPPMGDNDKLTIYGFEAEGEYSAYSKGMSDNSYYVSRVEAYCRAAKIPYTKVASQGGSENPKGKVPFANVKGTMIDDSAKIIALINQEYKVNLDSGLSDQQLALGRFIRGMLHGSLYWIPVHFEFHTEEGRRGFREEIGRKIPPVIVDLVFALVMRNMHNNLWGQGTGRMPEEDIIQAGKDDLKALSITLGKQEYLLGTKSPTSIDCDTYATLAFFFGHPFFAKMPWVAECRKEYPNLELFFERMKNQLYPELKNKAA